MSSAAFPSSFSASFIEFPARGDPDFRFGAPGWSWSLCVQVAPTEGVSWSASFSAPRPSGGHVLTGLLTTPARDVMCVVVRGTGYLANVQGPEGTASLPLRDEIVSAEMALEPATLLLICRWTIAAVTPEGLSWVSPSLADEEFVIEQINGAVLSGRSDPTSSAKQFRLDLRSGTLL